MVRPRSCRVIYYFDTPTLGRRHQSFGRVSGQGKNAKLNFACFIHNGPHFMRECLKKEKLNVILVNGLM